MARLPFDDYLRHLHVESARLREALAGCDASAAVPACPAWDARALLGHHAGVLHFWATIIEQRPAGPEGPDELETPSSYAELLAFHEAQAARLVAALEAADPAEPAWTWSDEQTVGFTFRRQAHEALIHRLDAEQTAGEVTPLDPALAADGVDEALDVMFGGTPPWGTFTGLPHFVRVDITDAAASVWAQLGRFTGTDPESGEHHDVEDINVVPDPGTEPEAVVSGPAAALDAWLWKRGDDREILVTGDPGIRDRFRACVDHPID
jgi:uncharacterized protein (TIGR03083 family)